MAFLAIPVELKLVIADFLNPREVFRLASTCRELHRICARALAKHKQLWQQYSDINPENFGHSIQKVANQVALKPDLAYYIEALFLPKDGDYAQPTPDTDATNNLVQHYLDVIRTQRPLWYEFDDWQDAWKYIILHSERPRLVGNFLIATAPNLRVLRFEHDPDNINIVLFNLISAIGVTIGDPTQGPHPPLCNLKTVQIYCDCCEIDVDEELSDWSECFLSLPSVERVVIITPNRTTVDARS